jgi:hypothetical protein
MNEYAPWLTLVLLGAYHGLNPGMGWLFAVALGLQEQRRAAVAKAFAPIAVGHAASITAVVAVVGAAQVWVSAETLRILGASVLVAFGLYKLLAPLSHPRWVGMRVNGRDLATWSFLMSTAHGAGLMLVPVLLRLPGGGQELAGHSSHAQHVALISAPAAPGAAELAAVSLHAAAMFLVMAAIAIVVYEKVGLAVLRRAWFNLDEIWAGALCGAGLLTLAF